VSSKRWLTRSQRALGELQHLLNAGSRRCSNRRGWRSGFAWKGESLEEYWWCTYQAVSHPDGKGPELVVMTAET
jgi:hypothetical protein